MTDRELLELIAKQVGVLTTDVSSLKNQVGNLTSQTDSLTSQVSSLTGQIDSLTNQVGTLTKDVLELKDGQQRVETEVKDIKKTVLNIEQEHGKKLSALFDGHVQNAVKLDRIEAEVVKHDEFILKRVR